MKKKIYWIIGIIFAVFLICFVGPGFQKNTSVFINDYTVSADGKEITLHVGVSSSMGYIRNAAVHQQQGGKLYLDFFSAFGGWNGKIGAKDTFTLSLNADTSIIAVCRSSNCYEEVLAKAADGSWQRTHP